ncbi:sulfate ABC transporter permease subunit CysT [bacterium]|nr:sulfate ABC transporter permease subunit CysT [bacterium]
MSKNKRFRLPGLGVSFGITLSYLSLMVVLPLAALLLKAASVNLADLPKLLLDPRVIAAFKVTFATSAMAALVNGVFGTLVAWVNTRYSYPGKRLLDAFIDLPFALPTAVAGIALTALFSQNAWVGQYLVPFGIRINYSWIGITIALIFVGLPFVIRTVEPVLDGFDKELEEAARTMGASRWQTFRYVIFPLLVPSILTGMTLAFARCLGEFGSVIFISGNMPGKTEIISLLIVTKLEQYDYVGAAVLSVAMLAISFGILLVINALQALQRRRMGME